MLKNNNSTTLHTCVYTYICICKYILYILVQRLVLHLSHFTSAICWVAMNGWLVGKLILLRNGYNHSHDVHTLLLLLFFFVAVVGIACERLIYASANQKKENRINLIKSGKKNATKQNLRRKEKTKIRRKQTITTITNTLLGHMMLYALSGAALLSE